MPLTQSSTSDRRMQTNTTISEGKRKREGRLECISWEMALLFQLKPGKLRQFTDRFFTGCFFLFVPWDIQQSEDGLDFKGVVWVKCHKPAAALTSESLICWISIMSTGPHALCALVFIKAWRRKTWFNDREDLDPLGVLPDSVPLCWNWD